MLLECAEDKEKISAKEVITADFLKERSSTINFRKLVASEIGSGKKIGDLIDNLVDGLGEEFRFTEDFTPKQAKEILRESLRTCNPNDKKFNAKKYGESYREGRLQYIQGMGDGLLRAFDRHIINLNCALEHTKIRISDGLTPKEIASMTKDLLTAVSLYQSIANAHQPESESPYDVLSELHNEAMLAEIEENAKAVAQNALQPHSTQALPDNSDNPNDDTSESLEGSES